MLHLNAEFVILPFLLNQDLYVTYFISWYNATATKEDADEMLNVYREKDAFLVRHSSADKHVFVVSFRYAFVIFEFLYFAKVPTAR
jgi:hypothetical protein